LTPNERAEHRALVEKDRRAKARRAKARRAKRTVGAKAPKSPAPRRTKGYALGHAPSADALASFRECLDTVHQTGSQTVSFEPGPGGDPWDAVLNVEYDGDEEAKGAKRRWHVSGVRAGAPFDQGMGNLTRAEALKAMVYFYRQATHRGASPRALHVG
jgi:hypothetical protein